MNADKQQANLEVMRGKPIDDEWHPTTATNGTTVEDYAYRFDGGKKGHGHFSSTVGESQEPAQYTVKLKQTDRSEPKWKYDINSVSFVGDGNRQLSWDKGNSSGTHATISNAVKFPVNAYYIVVVRRDDGALINCDPMISNNPKSG